MEMILPHVVQQICVLQLLKMLKKIFPGVKNVKKKFFPSVFSRNHLINLLELRLQAFLSCMCNLF